MLVLLQVRRLLMETQLGQPPMLGTVLGWPCPCCAVLVFSASVCAGAHWPQFPVPPVFSDPPATDKGTLEALGQAWPAGLAVLACLGSSIRRQLPAPSSCSQLPAPSTCQLPRTVLLTVSTQVPVHAALRHVWIPGRVPLASMHDSPKTKVPMRGTGKKLSRT